MRTNIKNKRGISLIVLVITIIVMIILAAAIILSISNSGIIGRSNEAKIKSDIKTLQEKLAVLNSDNTLDGNEVAISIGDLTSVEDYKNKFVVQDGILKYVTSKLTDTEKEWVKELGMESNATTLVSGQNGITITDEGVLSVVDKTKFTLTDIIIPNSVKSISEAAFYGCTSLTNVTISNSVTTIGGAAFSGTSLKEVIIPNSVTIVENGTFAYCKSLTNVTISDSVTSIGVNAFGECSALSRVTIPPSVRIINENTFTGCALSEIVIPNGVERIDTGAFSGCPLSTIVIPESVVVIRTCFYWLFFIETYNNKWCV